MLPQAAEIAMGIQLGNARVMDLYTQRTCGVYSGADGAPPLPNVSADCIVSVQVNFELLLTRLRLPKRWRLKQCISKIAAPLPHNERFMVLEQAELAIDRYFSQSCSKCNGSIHNTPCTSTTTKHGDQSLNIASERFVYLGKGVCATQRGTYYGTRFVPTDSGAALRWFSFFGDEPKYLSARLCCLLSAINTLNENTQGVIKNIKVMASEPTEKCVIGPLRCACVKASELEETDPVLVFVSL